MQRGLCTSGTTPSDCPICDETGCSVVLKLDGVSISRCRRCRHRFAAFDERPPTDTDYHEQYDQVEFLESLARTRQRQAGIILERVERFVPSRRRLLDIGSGRGWFLRTCEARGWRDLAASDSSDLALQVAISNDFTALVANWRPDRGLIVDLDALPFEPQVVTFLDVVEHFEGHLLVASLRDLLASIPPPKVIVIKVPSSAGLLYTLATISARVGVTGPLEQLYQKGTYPPHFHYFSPSSLKWLADRLGLEVVEVVGDLEFEEDELVDRVTAIGRMPRSVGASAGRMLGAIARWTGTYDSQIAFLTPRTRIQPGRSHD